MKLEEKLQNVATSSYVMDEKNFRENLEVLEKWYKIKQVVIFYL